MSLKRRNIIAIVLLLLAAAFWTYGQRSIQQIGGSNPTSTTAPSMHGTSVTHASFRLTEPANISSSIRDTGTSIFSASSAETVTESTRSDQMTGTVLCVLAVLCAFTGVLIRQNVPFGGPDGSAAVGALIGWIYCAVIRGSTPEYYFSNYAVFEVLYLFTALLVLRELVGWLWGGCPLDWCLIQRLARRAPNPQLSIFLYTAVILACALCIVWLWFFSTAQLIPILFILSIGILGSVCLWRYGTDLQHFQKQLTNFQQGHPITIRQGSFSLAEAQLVDIQSQHREAVNAAVTSERFKVELIANVSHDLRTPLTSILGYSELLQKQTLSEDASEQLHQLHLKAIYMNDLVDSLFELTKVSSGAAESNPEELDLIRLLEQTIGLLDDQLNDAGLIVRRHYDCETAIIVTDGGRVHQVFVNLLGNAIKYALSGTRIHLEVRETADHFLVRLVNTASYEMDFSTDEILQRFACGDKARSSKGSGLGLAIAQTYTESVGGRFHIQVDGDQFSAVMELPKTERNL